MTYGEKMILDFASRLMLRESIKRNEGKKNQYWSCYYAYIWLKRQYEMKDDLKPSKEERK